MRGREPNCWLLYPHTLATPDVNVLLAEIERNMTGASGADVPGLRPTVGFGRLRPAKLFGPGPRVDDAGPRSVAECAPVTMWE